MLKDYLQICWLNGYPEDLPTNKKFLVANLGIYLLLGLFIQANIIDPIEAFIQILIEVIITVLFMAGLLLKEGSFYHFERLLTATLVCENVIYFFALPLAFWFIFSKDSVTSHYPIYAGAVLVVWSVIIIAYLIKGLFDYSWGIGLVLSIIYFTLSYLGSFGILFLTGL